MLIHTENDNLDFELLKTIFDNMDDIVMLKDVQGRFLYGNQKLAELYDTTVENFIGKTDSDFNTNKEQVEFFLQNIQHIIKNKITSVVLESSTNKKTGEVRHYQSTKKPIFQNNQEPIILIVARDITDLYTQNLRLDNALNVIQEGIWEWNIPKNIVMHNAKWCEIVGYDTQYLQHSIDSFENLIYPQDKEIVAYRISKAISEKTSYISEHRLLTPKGKIIWVKDRGEIIEYDSQNNPVKMVGSIKDITELKNKEQEAKSATNLYQSLFEQSNDAIVLIDPVTLKFELFNELAYKKLGYLEDEFKRLTLKDIYLVQHVYQIEDMINLLLENKNSIKLQQKHIKKDGSYMDVNIIAKAIELKGKNYILSSWHDMTQSKLLMQQSKMASMGEMMSNIAHQWRQPLQAIGLVVQKLNIIYFTQGHIELKDIDDTIQTVSEQLGYLSKTIDDFSGFFKPDKQKVRIPLEKVIKKTLSIMDVSIYNSKTTIDNQVNKNIELYTYENELIQVFINIIKNAIDIFEERKIVDKILTIKSEVVDDFLYIKFIDNGGGINDSIISKVFDPYFTTKHQSRGTGIGLYMSHEIITKHLEGTLSVENIKFPTGKGACFIVALPQA